MMQGFSSNTFMNISGIIFIILFLFLFFIFLVYVLSFLRKKKKYQLEKKPHVSIIIPAYNEEKNITRCLSSILRSGYPLKKLEVIVVDDGSKDKTAKKVRELIKRNRLLKIRLARGKHKGKSEALNKGDRKSVV